jgi:hypothetical protein
LQLHDLKPKLGQSLGKKVIVLCLTLPAGKAVLFDRQPTRERKHFLQILKNGKCFALSAFLFRIKPSFF